MSTVSICETAAYVGQCNHHFIGVLGFIVELHDESIGKITLNPSYKRYHFCMLLIMNFLFATLSLQHAPLRALFMLSCLVDTVLEGGKERMREVG